METNIKLNIEIEKKFNVSAYITMYFSKTAKIFIIKRF